MSETKVDLVSTPLSLPAPTDNNKSNPTVRVAVVQAEPVWFDLQGAVKKAITIIDDAAARGARLVAFPEVWIPGYPATRSCDVELFTRYIKNSLRRDSKEMERICAAAARNSVAVSLGYAERDGNTLYLAQAFIDQNGVIQMNRRKIKPTHMERTVFGDGSGSSLLNVVDCAGIGRVGMLCCWEHSQPLLKFHTHSLGEQIHVAAWPAQLQHEEGKGLWSTANEGVQMNHVSDQYYAPGGGSSCIIRPDGKIMTEFIRDDQEGLVVADLDFDEILRSKAYLDTQGHYSRPDLLWLGVDSREKSRVKS
ncbi:unnamed protein product [Aureobasidium pullulans]|nr:unnamed protein product [Aureobasidium pullulans]